jgi:hypothetical protein
MVVELKAELVCDERFKKRFAVDERPRQDIPPIEVQEIEGVVDELHPTLAVARSLDSHLYAKSIALLCGWGL